MDKRVQHLRQQCANNKVCGTSHPGLCIANSNDDGKQCMLDMRMCAVGACVLCQPHPTLGNVGGHALYAAENSSCVLGLLCFYFFPGMVSETSRCLLLRPTQWCRIAWKQKGVQMLETNCLCKWFLAVNGVHIYIYIYICINIGTYIYYIYIYMLDNMKQIYY